MFTGIVQALRRVEHVEHDGNLTRLRIDLRELATGLQEGASVAVNGCCLTVTGDHNGSVSFDVIPETLRQTNLGELAPGSAVNIERSLRVGDELGGHRVSGHVTGTVAVRELRTEGHDRVVAMEVPPAFMRYLFARGFVALDGASLTISSLDRGAGTMEVSLIPETLARTTFGDIGVGDRVNIEVDAQGVAIVDTVATVLADPDWRVELGLDARPS